MQVGSIYNCKKSNQNFTAKLVDSYALRKLKAGLSNIEADTFEKYVKDIEAVNDGKNFIYKPTLIGNNKIAKIYEINKQETPIDPPLFVDFKGRSLEVFKQMADWYRNFVK